jgi:23S rRNA (guanosine2251-2'-O)-methyltransferase
MDENGRRGPRERRSGPGGGDWIWGRHAVLAALANPARAPLKRLLATAEAQKAVTADAAARRAVEAAGLQVQTMEAGEIGRAIGQAGASHQGLALSAARIPPRACW